MNGWNFCRISRRTPKLQTAKNQARLEKRFTPVTVEEKAGGGATVTLHTWEPTGELRIVHSATVNP